MFDGRPGEEPVEFEHRAADHVRDAAPAAGTVARFVTQGVDDGPDERNRRDDERCEGEQQEYDELETHGTAAGERDALLMLFEHGSANIVDAGRSAEKQSALALEDFCILLGGFAPL